MLTCLVDGKNTLYRHNYVSSLTDPEGQKVSGVFGMFKDISNILRIQKPDNLVIAWDKGKCLKRIEIYPEYKANRLNKDEEFLKNLGYQTKYAKLIFKFLPVKQITIEGIEADDVIGYLSKTLKGKKIIFSNDSDFLQLVNEDTSLFLATKKKLITKDNINDYLGFDSRYYVLWKSIVGDTSDNIRGQKGIGDKTAKKIILKEKKVTLDKEIIERNLKLIRIGKLLSNEDKSHIISQYKEEMNKANNAMAVRKIFLKLGFKVFLINFNSYVYLFNRLRQTKGK
jgi:DNA polymerase-1